MDLTFVVPEWVGYLILSYVVFRFFSIGMMLFLKYQNSKQK